MTIELKSIVEITLIVLTLKLIVARWKPPLQESVQALICIFLGTMIGCIANPTFEGVITGIIVSSFCFYGKDLLLEFKSVKKDLVENNIKIENKNLKNNSKK